MKARVIFLCVAVAVGAWLRAAYYGEGYGHPDEPITMGVVGHMRHSGDWDTNWAKAGLEATYNYDQYNFSSHLYATFLFYRAVKCVPGTAGWRSYCEGLLVYRFFSVLLALVALGMIWRLAQRAGGDEAALAAVALAAVAPLLVQDAHYARPEAFCTVLTLGAVLLAWPRADFSRRRVAGAALLVGMLVACKISMALLLWVPLVPVVVAWRRGARIGGWWAVAAMLGGAAGFAAGAPGAVLAPRKFFHGIAMLRAQYAGLHPPHSHVDGGAVADLMAGYFGATLGWGTLALAVAGTVLLVRRGRLAEAALLAGPVAAFAVLFGVQQVFFERNLSHVLPFALVLAAVAASGAAGEIRRRVRGPWPARALLAAGVAAVAWRPLSISARMVWVEFSGRGAERHEVAKIALLAPYAGIEVIEHDLLNHGALIQLAVRFRSDLRPVVLRVVDYRDEWSARYGPWLEKHFEAKLLADWPGTFADVPSCTLHTYLRPRERWYLVRRQTLRVPDEP